MSNNIYVNIQFSINKNYVCDKVPKIAPGTKNYHHLCDQRHKHTYYAISITLKSKQTNKKNSKTLTDK